MTTNIPTGTDILGALLNGAFKPMDKGDLYAFQGISGCGFVAEIKDYMVVLDFVPFGIRGQIIPTSEAGGNWDFEIPVPKPYGI